MVPGAGSGLLPDPRLSESWFYKWINRDRTGREQRRGELDATARELFEASGRTHGSPRIHRDLAEAGWSVSVNTVWDSMPGRACKAGRASAAMD